MQTHKDLEIWKRSIDLVTQVYAFTKKIPREERYGLTSQMRRAAVSYPSNIAEGAARNSTADYIRFVYIDASVKSFLPPRFWIVEPVFAPFFGLLAVASILL